MIDKFVKFRLLPTRTDIGASLFTPVQQCKQKLQNGRYCVDTYIMVKVVRDLKEKTSNRTGRACGRTSPSPPHASCTKKMLCPTAATQPSRISPT